MPRNKVRICATPVTGITMYNGPEQPRDRPRPAGYYQPYDADQKNSHRVIAYQVTISSLLGLGRAQDQSFQAKHWLLSRKTQIVLFSRYRKFSN